MFQKNVQILDINFVVLYIPSSYVKHYMKLHCYFITSRFLVFCENLYKIFYLYNVRVSFAIV